MPPGVAGVSGRAAILAYFTKDIASSKAGGVVFVINPKTDVGVSGDMGWESGTFKVTVKGAVIDTGKFLSVSRKKDGKWLYIRDTWNSDAPPVPAPAASPAPAKAPAAPSAPATPPAAKK
jgi:ketosteroid isomerase-like protein